MAASTPGSDAHGHGEDDTGEDGGAIFAEINITPLTDVFLVLLIILMVVSTSVIEDEKEAAYEKGLLAERALQVMTPESASDSDLVPEDITLSVLPDRTLYIENDPVPLAELDARLVLIRQQNPNTRIILRGDRSVPYQIIMDIIARCTNAGLNNVALASKDGPSTP